jgi:DNA-binding NarL/FixJ family response regulator
MEDIAILLLDSHKLIRDAFVIMLNSVSGYTVIGETDTISSAIEIAKNCMPAIIIIDIELGVNNGFDATRVLRKASPACLCQANVAFRCIRICYQEFAQGRAYTGNW